MTYRTLAKASHHLVQGFLPASHIPLHSGCCQYLVSAVGIWYFHQFFENTYLTLKWRHFAFPKPISNNQCINHVMEIRSTGGRYDVPEHYPVNVRGINRNQLDHSQYRHFGALYISVISGALIHHTGHVSPPCLPQYLHHSTSFLGLFLQEWRLPSTQPAGRAT